MAIEHKNIIEAERHEPKGASTAVIGYVLTSNGDTTTSFLEAVQMGWWYYHDLTTASTKIPLTLVGTDYELTNDGAGADNIVTYALPGVANIWNTATDRFDFTSLSIGDLVEVSVDISYTTTTVNSALTLQLELGTGSGSEVLQPMMNLKNVKTVGTFREVFSIIVPMRNLLVQNNPARIIMKSDTTGVTVQVNNISVAATIRGNY